MEVWVRLSLVHFKGRSRKLSFRTYLDMKLFRPLTGLTPIPGSCQPFQGNESHDIHPSERFGMIPPLSQCLDGSCFLAWHGPDFSVHAWRFSPLVFRHSSYSKSFAAERAG